MLLTLAACAGRSTAGQPSPPVTPPTPAEVVEAGERALEQYRQAFEVESIDALTELYAQGLDTTVIVQGRAHRGWTAVDKHLREFFDRVAEIRLSTSDVTVVALGDAGAQVTATLAREYKDGPSTIRESGPLSLTLVRVSDRWVIVGEHYSYALQ